MRRRFRLGLVFLLLGLVTTVTLAWLLAVLLDVQQGRESSGSAFIDQVQWSVTRWDRAGAIQISSIRIKGANWSPHQAAGAPDTPSVGDQTSAWASQTPDGGTEWLILSYAKAVVPKEVDIYESCAPGAVFKVSAFDENDHETEAWSGNDPSAGSTSSGGQTPVSKIPLSTRFPTRKIKIYLASDKVLGWNEIDAVGLVGDKNELQWARSVQASSTYASGFGSTGGGGDPQVLVPSWTRLRQPSDPMLDDAANREDRQVDARGWPMVALMSQVDRLASGSAASVRTPPVSAYTTGSLRSTGTFAVATPSAAHLPVPIPFLPVWNGLVGDTLFYAVIWLVAWGAMTVPRRFVREVARVRRGACIECGYDLGYDFIHGCPECGWRRDRVPRPRTTTSPALPPRRTSAQDAASVH